VTLACIDGYLKHKAILVAVDKYLLDLLKVAALLAFFPQFLSASAEVSGVAGLNGQIQSLLIHKADHQDLPGLCILSHSRNQTVPVEFWGKFKAIFIVLSRSHYPVSYNFTASLQIYVLPVIIHENKFF
jgi:hypothetical protein